VDSSCNHDPCQNRPAGPQASTGAARQPPRRSPTGRVASPPPDAAHGASAQVPDLAGRRAVSPRRRLSTAAPVRAL